MAIAFQCEACEEYGRNEPVAIVTITTKEPMPAGKGSKEYDLCGKCLDELRQFLTPVPEPTLAESATVDVPFQSGHRYDG
jgi:hypothetical protein